MPKMIVLYGEPTNREQFDKVHHEIFEWTKKMPGVTAASYRKVVQTQHMEPSPYLVAEIEFLSMEDIRRTFELGQSPEAQADAKRLQNYLDRPRTVIVLE